MEFHEECESFYHILNIYMGCIAPNTARCSQEVWDNMEAHTNRFHTETLEEVDSHFFSLAVHFNSSSYIHKDDNSCQAEFDAIGVIGRHQGGTLFFPELGISLLLL